MTESEKSRESSADKLATKGKKRRSYLKTAAALVLMFVVGGAAGWGLRSSMFSVSPTVGEQTLIVGTTHDVADLRIGMDDSWAGCIVYRLCYDTMLSWQPPGYVETMPWVAKNLSVSADGMAWDVYLFEDGKFADGTPIDAAAVKYDFDWFKRPEVLHSWIFGGVNSTEVIGNYQIRVHLNSPDFTLFPKAVLAYGARVFSPTMVQRYPDEWGRTSEAWAGSGPFKLTEWIKGDQIVIERDDNWWGISHWGKPTLQKIIIKLFKDPLTMRLALEKGEIDVFTREPNPQDISIIEQDPDIRTFKQPMGWTRFLTFNCQIKPFDDKRVRQAIAYGINKTRLLELGFKGLGKPAYSFINDWLVPYYKAVFQKYDYNPDAAKALLADAGYPDGFTMDLTWTPAHYGSQESDVAALIADDLAKIGVQVNLHMEEFGTMRSKLKEGTVPAWLYGWYMDYPDPDNVLTQIIHPELGAAGIYAHWTGVAADNFSKLGYDGRTTTDVNERKQIYDEMQDIVAEDVPAYPLCIQDEYRFVQQWVNNYNFYPNTYVEYFPTYLNITVSAH